MNRHEAIASIGEELCQYCPWKEEEHHPLTLCGRRFCEEAYQRFLDDNQAFFDDDDDN